jgi:L-ascorbate metabolism protein UlaG (beta-lactamase superfamily)
MKKMTILIIISALVAIILSINLFIGLHPTFGAKKNHINTERLEASENYKNGEFKNQEETVMMTEEGNYWKALRKFFFSVENDRPSDPVESIEFDKSKFVESTEGIQYTWFGHSTVLLNMDGKIIITDPVFSKAASPVSFFNKAFKFEDDFSVDILPELDVVLISHDHYDHLDYETILKINTKTKKFIVPLGVDAHLLRWGIPSTKIEIADWGDTISIDSCLNYISTPARHFSGRGTKDRNTTLWCSWVIESNNQKIFFGGDSGYGKHFKEIGNKYGPFDLTMIECGQYNENWNQIHAMPEQSVQANVDLQGKRMLPIHWSKYKLSIHSWTEPIERAVKESEIKNCSIELVRIGEIIEL